MAEHQSCVYGYSDTFLSLQKSKMVQLCAALETHTQKRKYFYSFPPANTENTTNLHPETKTHTMNTPTLKFIP